MPPDSAGLKALEAQARAVRKGMFWERFKPSKKSWWYHYHP